MTDYYDSISSGYVELHRDEQLEKYRIVSENLDIHLDTFLLDVACGPGFGTFKCNVVGLDKSSKLLCKCEGMRVHGTAEELPFIDNAFDIVVSITALQNFEDPKTAILEISRVGNKMFAISYLKKSPRANLFDELIQEQFHVKKRIKQRYDIIYILTKKFL